MDEAVAVAAGSRTTAPPNPWVGCVIVPAGDGPVAEGATQPPGGDHAEVVALDLAGESARGATAYVTLEPCSHHGRTPPCADALIDAGVKRVVVGVEDPDTQVGGAGIRRLREAGVAVEVGVAGEAVRGQLAPYLKHRRTGRPWVVLKLATSLDGRIAAPDGTSRWITGPEARKDAHRLRAESDAILVGAGTVRADDPALTVRIDQPAVTAEHQPLRVVLGQAPESAKIHPAVELSGPLPEVLDDLGRRDILQVLVEGGAGVAGAFHRERLVDHYVVYLAPALFGGDDARPVFAGPGAESIGDLWRGSLRAVTRLGDDLRVDLDPADGPNPPPRV